MTRSYRKNILRTLKSARSRFLAIFSIVALGVGFLAGLNATPIDMKESMERYMDDANFYDLRIVSTLGLTDGDVEALRQVEGVEAVQPAYSADLLVDAGEDVLVSRVQSLPPEGEDGINRLFLAEGRMPQNSGECVIEAGEGLAGEEVPLGMTLTVSAENEDLDTKLARTEYTVVGVVHNANYFSFEREPASVGNGTVELVLYLLPEDFAYETYTEIYVTAEGALAQNSLEDEYTATVEAVQANVEAIQQERCDARYEEIRAEAQAEIDDAWAEYYDAEAEAQQELADAAAELEDGRRELAEGQQEYEDGEREYADGAQEIADNEALLNDGLVQIQEAVQLLQDNQKQLEDGEAELAANAPALEEARRKLENGQAEYEDGLQQYNDGLAQIEEGERQLAEGKAQLDQAEESYQAGVDQAAQQVSELLQEKLPWLTVEVGAEDVQGFIDWLNDGEREVPASYDDLLDDLGAYVEEQYGLSVGALLPSAARDVQKQAQNLLEELQQEPPAGSEEETPPTETKPEEQPPETVQTDRADGATEEPPAEEASAPAEELPADATEVPAEDASAVPSEPADPPAGETGEGAEQPDGEPVPEEASPEETAPAEGPDGETATPEQEAGPETEPAADGVEVSDGTAKTALASPTAWTGGTAAPTENTENAAEEPLETAGPQDPAQGPEEPDPEDSDETPAMTDAQRQELEQQLNAILTTDRAQMKSVLEAAQAWLAEQEEPLPELVEKFQKMVEEGLTKLAEEQAQTGPLVAGFAQMVGGRRTLDQSWDAYYENEQKLIDGRKQLEAGKPALEEAKRLLDEGWAEYEAGLAEYEAGKRRLADARVQLDEGWATLTDKQLELADAQVQLADARAQLADARAELDDARATIAENVQKLRDGEIEYEDGKAEAEQELADARAEIEDAQRELDDIEQPEWYIWDRSNNVSYASFTGNVEKLTAITTIFPIFFFLVAALVVSTTMTRMVEEERLQIGTLKALGYARGEIMQKYLCYALAAAALGTLAGLAIGFVAFPKIIWSAYAMMYYMPSIATPWRLAQALFAGGTLIVLTVGVTALTCRASLQEVPAALMLPRAPKAGKRILLERITPLWRRLPFTWKVTCRNLLRYKRRFWMTVIGVAGCTALLVAGFGISDSLNAIITKQYAEISHYDLTTIVTQEEATQEGPVYDYLYGEGSVEESLTVSMETTRQESPEGEIDIYLMIPQDVQRFADFADLHERVSRKATPLGEEGVVLTEKMASIFGVRAGDTITLKNQDDVTGTFTVTGVCEHYVSNYVYMSAATYQAAFGVAPTYNAVISRLADDSQETRDAISAELLEMDKVASLSFTEDNVAQVQNMLQSIDAVVVLIIVCAACLAFVVLYNLSSINVAERVKEIATIKVLGFYDREVNAYVNRESVALTLAGILFGVFAGIALHRFIILTVEVDAVMFGREIAPLSFACAVLLTLLFSTIVNLVMQRTLKKISMVESMKAPE